MTEPAPQTVSGALQDSELVKPPRSQWVDVWEQFKHHKGAVLGMGFLIFITLAVLIGPLIWTIDPQKLDIRNKDLRPIYTLLWDGDAKTAWNRPFGTDNLGRDGLANMMAGGQASMAVGWSAMLLSLKVRRNLPWSGIRRDAAHPWRFGCSSRAAAALESNSPQRCQLPSDFVT